MKSTIRILAALVCVLAVFCAGFAMAETAETPTVSPTPVVTPAVTPGIDELGELTFVITDEEGTEVKTVKYSEFTDGKYTLEDLEPGKYTVTEVEPDKLLKDYTFVEDSSVQSVTLEVLPDGTASDTLKNVYERTVEVTPTPTPEPTETPTPTPTPEPTETPNPEEDEKVTVPVVKVWNDFGNRDGNRPDRVIVSLLANGNKTAQAVLTAATGWSYQFADLPKYAAGEEIVYTVAEDPVAMYTASIDGFTITNNYNPPTTSATVSKVWADNNNSAGIRPVSIYCTLSNGTRVILNQANNWTATVENLPTIVNGQPATYTWSEQEVIGYTHTSTDVVGNTTVFTNTLVERGGNPPEGKNPPKKGRGNNYLIIEDYGTPLGVEVVINHVGDCFD